ncbi:MAG TPA: TonB-dependent receptor [Polyangiaceae bacterium]
MAAQLFVAGALHAQAGEDAEEPEFEGVAEVEAPPSEPSKRVLEGEQLTSIPGTRGDALRAIEALPGVSRTQFGVNPGPPLLRGSPAYESAVFFDGSSTPVLYHFGGLTSIFNSHLLESVTLYPGNYSARYGRAAGGIVDVRVRDPKSDRLHFMLELSAIDSFALVEGPVADKTSLALAARRSNVDLFIGALIDDESTAVIAAPVYWDYQAILSHRFSDQHHLRAMVYGSYDAFELHFGKAAAEDPSLHGEFGGRDTFHRVQLELKSRLSSVVEQRLMLSGLMEPGRGQLGSVSFDFESYIGTARADWAIFAAPWLRLDAGLDVVILGARGRYQGPAPAPTEGLPSQGSLASETQITFDASFLAPRPAAYVEAKIQPTPAVLVLPSVRFDHYGNGGDFSIDPRLATRLRATETTTFKAGVGKYSQPPEYWEVFEAFGNPELRHYSTLQTSVGVEQELGRHLHVDVDTFYKRWQDRIVGTPGGVAPVYVNGGSGNAYGLELLLKAQFTARTQAFAAYTLSRSTRRDDPSAAPRLFDHDQTHNLSLTGNVDLGRGWQFSARFRYVTGDPYTAVQGVVYDASSDTYRPLYGELYGERNPAFHQLDLRVEKPWTLGPVTLTAYVEIMNVYSAQNQERRRYSYDYSASAGVVGMPFFPNLGLRGEL